MQHHEYLQKRLAESVRYYNCMIYSYYKDTEGKIY